MDAALLEQRLKLFDSEAGRLNDRAHSVGLHRVASRNNDKGVALSHDNMSALSGNDKARFFKSSYGCQMVDLASLGHSNVHGHGHRFSFREGVLDRGKIIFDRASDVLQGFFPRFSL
jgi:hypothetical protein